MKQYTIAKYRLAYQEMLRYQKTKKITKSDLKYAMKNLIRINQSKEQINIINEGSINYKNFNNLIESIKCAKNGFQYSYKLIFSYLPKTFQYYQEFKHTENKIPFYIYKIDLNNKKQIYQIFNWFIEDISLVEENVNFLHQNCKDDKGLIIPFPNNLYIFVLNRKIYDDMTICHQLTHYFQFALGIEILDDVIFSDADLEKIKFLNISKQYLEYLFSKKQFIPHINDCCQIFAEMYLKKFIKIKNIQDFKNQILNFANTLNIKFNSNYIFILFLELSNSDISSLYTFLLSIYLNKNKEKTLQILNKTFNDLGVIE